MSQHDCEQEETLHQYDRRITDTENKTSNVNGKIAVLMAFLGLILVTGFTTVKDVAATAQENEKNIATLTEAVAAQKERDEELLKRLDKVLTVVEKIDTRVREIEIKQAEGQGSKS